ncbi:MAG: hypothetical protein ACOY3I_06520 [Verrucomicrobiota bacterium]
MVGLIRTLFIILPLGFFVWYMVYHDSLVATYHKVNEMQGRHGALIINQPGERTVGQHFSGFLESQFGEKANTEWRMFFARSGRDLDTVIRCIEDYWIWMSIAICIISGATILYVFRNYK